MKTLLLRRQKQGGIATLTDNLAMALPKQGITATVEEASDWIPNETGLREGKIVSRRLREIGERFDIVHAFGYRAAWAASEAFGHKEAWIYSAYDMPKTVHPLLIDKLNHSQFGECSSYAVARALERVNALDIHVHSPGLPVPTGELLQRPDARDVLEIPHGVPLVSCIGRFAPERGFLEAIEAMATVWEELPEAHLLISGEGPLFKDLIDTRGAAAHPEQIKVMGIARDLGVIFAASDLICVPSTRAGFSMVAAEAMLRSVPVLLASIDGLPEMIEPDISGFLFQPDEMGKRISGLLQMPLTLQAVGVAGRIRAESRFDMERYAKAVAETYRAIIEV